MTAKMATDLPEYVRASNLNAVIPECQLTPPVSQSAAKMP